MMHLLHCVMCGIEFQHTDARTKTCSPECCTARLKQHAKDHNYFTGKHGIFPKHLEWIRTHSGVNSPTYGKPHSAEVRAKISAALKGNPALRKPKSLELRLKISNALKGKTASEETRAKLRKAQGGENNPWYGKHLSQEHKDKISKANKGHPVSPESRLKMSLSHKNIATHINAFQGIFKICPNCNVPFIITLYRYRDIKFCSKRCWRADQSKRMQGKGNWIYGIGHTEETKAKLKINHYDSSGDKNGRWLGGKSFEQYTPDFSTKTKEIIRHRDDYECQICHCKQNGRAFNIHHIDYNKKNNSLDNLIALCDSCHGTTNLNRKNWIDYFNIVRTERGIWLTTTI